MRNQDMPNSETQECGVLRAFALKSKVSEKAPDDKLGILYKDDIEIYPYFGC